MEGEIRSSENKLLASAKIYQDMNIIAKRCDALPEDTSDQDSIWPGILIGSSINRFVRSRAHIQGSDPMRPAEVMCIQECLPINEAERAAKWQSEFPPAPTIGDVVQPPAQDPSDIEGLEDLEGMTSEQMDDLLSATINPRDRRSCRSLNIPDDIPEHAKREIDGTWHIYFQGSEDTFNIESRGSRSSVAAIGAIILTTGY